MSDFDIFFLCSDFLIWFWFFSTAREYAEAYLHKGRNKKKVRKFLKQLTIIERITLKPYPDYCKVKSKKLEYAIVINDANVIYYLSHILIQILRLCGFHLQYMNFIILFIILLIDIPFGIFAFFQHDYSENGGKKWIL